ncbi:hypothetical protein MCGE09_00572 [Thaumarchaeota archaeon SCGC AB-539-E09]|nr:hypothetical protein MCGE09_00572 [Thaumarchaeota archaeon SCGC AB-539-E09]
MRLCSREIGVGFSAFRMLTGYLNMPGRTLGYRGIKKERLYMHKFFFNC